MLSPPAADASQPIRRLLVVRMSAMGDVIHALPAVCALRCAFPNIHIGWLIERRWRALLSSSNRDGPRGPRQPLADSIHAVDTKKWRKQMFSRATNQEFFAAIRELRHQHYDAAIDFQGLLRSAMFARFSLAPCRYGFAQPREHAARFFYTDSIPATGTHVIEQNISLASAFAAHPLSRSPSELPIHPDAEARAALRLDALAISRFAILNPGAGWNAKQWPAERYGLVARALSGMGYAALVNFGPGEQSLADAVISSSAGTAHAFPCTLSELIALTRHAALFIGGDTGPMHLAAALGIPVVAIFGPTDPARNGPFGTRSTVLRDPLSRTDHSRHALDHGIARITVDQVVSAAQKLLEPLND